MLISMFSEEAREELERLLQMNRHFAQILSLGYFHLDHESVNHQNLRVARISELLRDPDGSMQLS
ncbi:hypothetical protein [Pseudomonas sp. AK106]|jgi:hypothetical protein